MPPNKDDLDRLGHMVEFARKALIFSKGKSRSDLDRDEQLALALTRLIEIIGEAASRISNELKSQYPSIPWLEIIGTRNRLVHAYFDVDLDVMWKIVKDELAPLVKEVEKIIENETGEAQQEKLF